MIDTKRTNPGIAFLNIIESLNGQDVLQLAEKDPNFSPDSTFIEATQKIFSSDNFQYSNLNGDIELREKVAQCIEHDYTYKYNPVSEITITSGASSAIATAISAFVKDGDEVIIFEPAYFTYASLVLANGGRPVYIQLKQPDFRIDWDDVQKGISSRTRLIIINTPHNPTGTTFTAFDLDKLAKIVNGTKIIILSDESFQKIIFDKLEHQSIARFPKLAERSLIVSSLSKNFMVDGCKIGYCAAPVKIMEEFRRLHHILSFSVNTPFQKVFSEIIENNDITKNIIETLQAKRNIIVNGLKNSKFKLRPSSGTYYQIFNYSEISETKDIEFVQFLREKKQITVFPLSHFYHDISDQKSIRICFAQPDDILNKALEVFNSL